MVVEVGNRDLVVYDIESVDVLQIKICDMRKYYVIRDQVQIGF